MSHRVACPDFVGRRAELDVLASVFETARTGRAGMVLIGGDAGAGKSRLVDEFRARALQHGAVAATGVCVPSAGGGLPYAALLGILRDIGRQHGRPAAAEDLKSLVAGLGGDGHSPSGVEDSGASRLTRDLARTRLLESFLSSIGQLSERAPVVIVFEDLHWADSASAELVDFLARNLTDAEVLMVGTYRSDELSREHHLRPWLRELARNSRVTHLSLTGLGRDETTRVIAGILERPPDETLVDAIWTRSQGNPFFIEELAAARGQGSISPELRGVVMARVESLSDLAQRALRLVAAAGLAVDHRLLAATATLAPDDLATALAEAVDQQVLVVDDTNEGYRFRHALLREAVYDALLPGERSALHRQLAVALEADESLGPTGPGHRSAELAAHWWAAGAWVEALASSKAAADAARAVWAFPEALTHLERALAALDRIPLHARPDGNDRLGMLEDASEVAYLAGAGQRSVDLIRAAIAIVERAGDTSAAARCYTVLGRNAWAVGDRDAAFAAYRHAAGLLPTDPPTADLAGVLAEEARGLMIVSRLRDSEARCHEAIAAARAAGARAIEGQALNTLGCCRANLGYYDEGIRLLQEALAIAEEVGRPDDLDRAYGNLSGTLVDSGELEAGAALVYRSVADQEYGGFFKLNGAAGNSATALIRLGRYDEAEALLREMGDRGIGVCASAPVLVPVPMAIRRGRFADAARLLADADEFTSGLADVQTRGLFHIEQAELALEEGRPDDAYEEVERALALAAATDDEIYSLEMCALGVRALADRFVHSRSTSRRSDPDKLRLLALALVDRAQQLVDGPAARGGQCPPSPKAFARTCVAEHSRLHRSDPDLWLDAANAWEQAREPYPAAYCHWRRADAILEGRGERSAAGDSLRTAWRVATDLGAVPLAARIQDLGHRARLPLADDVNEEGSTLAGDLGLTPREVEVLGQLAAGRTDGEIAEALFISKKTASVHVSNLIRKLDVDNRVEAGRLGRAHGL